VKMAHPGLLGTYHALSSLIALVERLAPHA
jgi:hypothetical protein